MQNVLGQEAVSVLAPIDAAATVNATSGWVDVRGYSGVLRFILHAGILDASTTLDWTFEDATSGAGAGSAAITPASGALTQVTTSNDDPNIQIATFDANAPRGWMRVIGTIVTGGALVSVCLLALPKRS